MHRRRGARRTRPRTLTRADEGDEPRDRNRGEGWAVQRAQDPGQGAPRHGGSASAGALLATGTHAHRAHEAQSAARHETGAGRWDTSHSTVRAAPRHPSPRTTSPHARAGSHGGERVWAPQNIGLNTSAENRTGQVKIWLQSSISHAEEHWATLLRARAGRAARHGRNELHARRGGGERVGRKRRSTRAALSASL